MLDLKRKSRMFFADRMLDLMAIASTPEQKVQAYVEACKSAKKLTDEKRMTIELAQEIGHTMARLLQMMDSDTILIAIKASSNVLLDMEDTDV